MSVIKLSRDGVSRWVMSVNIMILRHRVSVRYYEGGDLCSQSQRITRNHVYKSENVPLQLVALPILNSLYQVVIWRTGDWNLSLIVKL